MDGRIQFFLILGIALILAPPFRQLLQNAIQFRIPWWLFLVAAGILWSGVLLSFALNPAKSIYKSDSYRDKLTEIYDSKLADWPVPYESVYLNTRYGKIQEASQIFRGWSISQYGLLGLCSAMPWELVKLSKFMHIMNTTPNQIRKPCDMF